MHSPPHVHTAPLPSLFFFFNDTATTEIYTLSLHDALPISHELHRRQQWSRRQPPRAGQDRKSTRLNSSHQKISYAVFCLKKKKRKGGSRVGWKGRERRTIERVWE